MVPVITGVGNSVMVKFSIVFGRGKCVFVVVAVVVVAFHRSLLKGAASASQEGLRFRKKSKVCLYSYVIKIN